MEDRYIRKVQTGVTCFLHHKDEYLFLKRGEHKRVDPGRLNGVGGRLEPGENYLAAAIREVKEETGYDVDVKDINFRGLVKLEGGYQEDWVVGVFVIEVGDTNVPVGNKTDDGELIWIDKDKVLDTKHEMVDDVRYYFKELIESKAFIFMNAQMDDNAKVITAELSLLG